MNSAVAAPLLACRALGKTYASGGGAQVVLQDVSLQLMAGEVTCLVGASGSGKTTLLHLLGALDAADTGEVLYQGRSLAGKSGEQLAQWRNQHVAFVFQFHLLLPEFTALENAAMPLYLRRQAPAAAHAAAAACLDTVGLAAHARKTPDKLSGGERQRVAIARALAGAPSIILADEPTGNLDRKNADLVYGTLIDQCRQRGTALLVASHDEKLAQQADRVLTLADGKLQ